MYYNQRNREMPIGTILSRYPFTIRFFLGPNMAPLAPAICGWSWIRYPKAKISLSNEH